MACHALRSGECTLALAGGVTVLATPRDLIGFSRQRGLAPDGRSKAFSADADGMGMAEGAGILAVERLSDARRLGHPVLAVVSGSAVNQDGASNGLTAPNGPSQQRVIRAALAGAGLSGPDVDVVEAHGTGTPLGDPMEAQALLATYGEGRDAGRPLWLGSVKSNIGHTQAAAGAAGVIKMVLALSHRRLPATLHADQPSPHVDWSSGALRLLTEPVDWAAGEDRPRRAAVSGFGMSGTNAHVIIEEPPAEEPPAGTAAATPVLPGACAWPVSGRGAAALAGQAGRLREAVLAHPDWAAADVAWSLAGTRSAFEHRAVLTGADRDELVAGLASVATGQQAPGVVTGAVPAGGPGRVGFLFAGQGSQRAGMGRELHAASPVFAEAFDRVAALLEAELGVPVAEVVLGSEDDERADRTLYAQTGLFAVQVGLCALLAAAGIRPDAVAGHSVGEIAAAHAAGVLSLEDAVRLVAARARLMQALPEGGAMAAIAATEEEMTEALDGVDGVSLAAVNGPESVVVSGDAGAVERLAEAWHERGRRVRRLRVSHAFHSARMDPVLDELERVADGLEHAEPAVPWAGALTGELVGECGPEYWSGQAREAVRFADAARALAGQGVTTFVEIGPDGTLSAMAAGALPDSDAAFVPVLRPDGPATGSVLAALAGAYVRGAAVDWPSVLGAGRRVELPTYAFQRQRYWPRPVSRPAGADAGGSPAETEFWTAVENGDRAAVAGTLAVDGERLDGLLPALASWRRREREDAALAGWRYRVRWSAVPDGGPAVLTGRWLLVTGPGVAEAVEPCLRALRDGGAEVRAVELDGAPDRAEVAARLAAALPDGAPVAGVLSLVALDETPTAGSPVLTEGLAATLSLVQALGDREIDAPLWVATRGAVATGSGDGPTRPLQAQVWGLGRVVALEHPDRWGGLVDLPLAWDERSAARLGAVLAGCGEDQVALRAEGVAARRLERAPRPVPNGHTPLSPRGTALITGGTGSIGEHVGSLLAGRGAPRLVLTSDTGPADEDVSGLAAELAGSGTQVQVLACDITERDQVSGLLDRIHASGPPLSAVVHAEVVGQATAVADTTLAEQASVMGAKAAGARWLDELTDGLDLEAFVLFSSITAIWGSGQRPAYAAANTFVDALAEARRARGRSATSVAWGLWGGREAQGGAAAAQSRRHGLRLMDPKDAMQAFAQVLDAREESVTVADVDWERFAPTFTVRRPSPLLAGLPEVERILAGLAAAEQQPAGGDGPDLAGTLAGLSRAEQDRVLVDLVRSTAGAVLEHPAPETIEPDRPFTDLGFDSLTSVELRNRLGAATGTRLSSTLVFDHPTPAALAGHLRGVVAGDADPDNPAVLAELDKVESMLNAVTGEDDESARITARLDAVVARWKEIRERSAGRTVADDLESSTDDEVFEYLGTEFGIR
jgi:acyl transferase domain-containing protein